MRLKSSHIARRLIADDTGSVLAFWGVTLSVFLGLIALSFDFGRLASTQSELQSYVDSVALAAAGELDGKSDAITRAAAAAEAFISDTQTFGSGDAVLNDDDDFTLAFYASPPTATTAGVAASDAENAGFVEVVATNQAVSPIFGAAFSAMSGVAGGEDVARASAVAGYTQYACDVTPLMFCAPNAEFRADANVGATALLRAGGPDAAWGPGAFGFLDPSATIQVDEDGVCAGLSGTNLDVCLISAVGNKTSCFAQNGVDVAGGQRVGNFEAALNVRFDIYHATTNNLRNSPLYPPAPNVLSSWEPDKGKCIGNTGVLSTDKVGLPADDCHSIGLCDRFGDADWSDGRANYVAVNYGGSDPHPEATTRYEYYLAEIEASASTGGLGGLGGLLGGILPQCSSQSSDDPGRRVVVAASIDCSSFDLKGGASDVPVLEFVELFLTAPIGLDGTKDIWVEIIGGVGGGAGSSSVDAHFREVVQLYR